MPLLKLAVLIRMQLDAVSKFNLNGFITTNPILAYCQLLSDDCKRSLKMFALLHKVPSLKKVDESSKLVSSSPVTSRFRLMFFEQWT